MLLRFLVIQHHFHHEKGFGRVRADPLRCDPNTRVAIIEDITVWIKDQGRTYHILWLRGSAGIGKSAIAKVEVAGSFFFFKADPRRNSLDYFVATIVYRLAVTLQDVGREIDRALEQDPKILYADMAVQWKKLVVQTVMSVPNTPPAVFITDGLDECGNERDQRKLLDPVTSCGPRFPIAFLIASRPEPHIVNCFNADTFSFLCRHSIDLARCHDRGAMNSFIRSSFSRFYTRHRDILRAYSTNSIWPSEDIAQRIADRANRQYIYPVTLFKYIDEDYSDLTSAYKSA
ncbi:hypothetical protein AX16_006507 [Volvariella volvacea WC 439]|nr:hypothetical protein AX16_006507 [Volvariella volvacea WC 439]